MFDRLASSYGYTPDEIFNLTLIQINSMLECAGVREHNDYAAQAALHGRKVKTRSLQSLDLMRNAKKQQAKDEVDYDKIDAEMSKMMQDIKK